jgi:hypothetical protein
VPPGGGERRKRPKTVQKRHIRAQFAAHFRPTRRVVSAIVHEPREDGVKMRKSKAGKAQETKNATQNATQNVTQGTTQRIRSDRGETAGLVHRYGKIGISAVAAAVRYQGGAKNPAYAPASAQMLDWLGEAAA